MGRPELPKVGEPRLMTMGDMAEKLGMPDATISYRIKRGIFPPATTLDAQGNRLFSQAWLEEALKIRAGEGK